MVCNAKSQVRNFKGKCFICDRPGILGYDLIIRGEQRPRNLICDDCWQKHAEGTSKIPWLPAFKGIWRPTKW